MLVIEKVPVTNTIPNIFVRIIHGYKKTPTPSITSINCDFIMAKELYLNTNC